MRYWIIIISLLIVGCSSNQQVLPTLVEIPTETETPTLTATYTPTITPTPAPAIFFQKDNLTFIPESFLALDALGNRTFTDTVALVIHGLLRNEGSRNDCAYASDVRLIIHSEEYAPQGGLMSAYHDTLENQMDYIGAVIGQCVSGNTEEATFVVFEIPRSTGNFSLRFAEQEELLGIELATILRQSSESFSVAQLFDLATREGTEAAINQTEIFGATETASNWTATPTSTNTATVTATFTSAPTATASITSTSLPTLPPTVTPVPTIGSTTTYYVDVTDANVRDASTDGNRIGSVFFGQEIEVIQPVTGDSVSGNTTWYQIRFNGQIAYIHSSLLSATRPAPTSAPANIPQSNTSSQSERPRNCATAVAMGLTAQQAAQWSHLDADRDGVACYGD